MANGSRVSIDVTASVTRAEIAKEITPTAHREVLAGVRRLAENVKRRLGSSGVADAIEPVVRNTGRSIVGRIESSRGGPGIIRPIRAQALRFVTKGGDVVFAAYVRGKGIAPLIVSEARKLQSKDFES